MLGFVWAALLCADTGRGVGEECALRWRPQSSLYSQRLAAMCRALPAGGRSTCNSTLISVDRLVRLQIAVDRAPYDVSFCVANGSASATEAQARRFAAEACQKLGISECGELAGAASAPARAIHDSIRRIHDINAEPLLSVSLPGFSAPLVVDVTVRW